MKTLITTMILMFMSTSVQANGNNKPSGYVEFLNNKETFSIPENATPYTVVGKNMKHSSIMEYDTAGHHQAHLQFTDNSNEFDIGYHTGTIRVAQGASFDFKNKKIYTFTVGVEDYKSNEKDHVTVKINITNIIEDGTPTIDGQTIELLAGSTGNTGRFVAASGDNLQFSESLDDLDIDSASGEISIAPGKELSLSGYTFTVTVENTVTNETDSATVTIVVVEKESGNDGLRRKSHSNLRELEHSVSNQCLVSDTKDSVLVIIMAGLVAMLLLISFRKHLAKE